MLAVVDFGRVTFCSERARSEREERNERGTYGMLDTYTFDEWQDGLKGETPMVTEPS